MAVDVPRFCSNCGAQASGAFCSNCGASLSTSPSDPSKSTATPVEVTQGKTSYRWAWVAGGFVVTLIFWIAKVWVIAILLSIAWWILLGWAVIASAVASGVSRGSRRS